MTAVAPTPSRASELSGTASLVRFMLRRDRVKLPAWAAGIALFVLYIHTALPAIAATEAELLGATALFADPVGRMMIGPGYGFDAPSYPQFIANGYGLYFLVTSALMSILLIVRHTRVEEQTGRAELVRANVVGRHAPLTAAMLVAVITNLVVVVTAFVAMAGVSGYPAGGSLLFASSIGAVGLAFAGVTTITVQLSEYSRAAAGMSGMVLGASFIVRGGGDMAAVGGTALSWFAPLAWGQQTAPFVLDRWWPLALALGFAVVTSVVGFTLSSRRDLAASRFAVRAGNARAANSLGTPFGLAFRLQRASIIGWGASLIVAGVSFGAFADALVSAGDELPEVFFELFSDQDMVAGYLGYMAAYMAFFVAAYAVMSVQSLRAEETSGRLEPVLSLPLSRSRWFGTNLSVTAAAALVMLAVVGAATGVGAALVTGQTGYIWDLTLAHINQAPAVLVVLGIAALLFGAAPRGLRTAWVLVGYGLIIGTFGPLLDAPQVAMNLSPFTHPAQIPLEAFTFTPIPLLVAVAIATAVGGIAAFRRRDLTTT